MEYRANHAAPDLLRYVASAYPGLTADPEVSCRRRGRYPSRASYGLFVSFYTTNPDRFRRTFPGLIARRPRV